MYHFRISVWTISVTVKSRVLMQKLWIKEMILWCVFTSLKNTLSRRVLVEPCSWLLGVPIFLTLSFLLLFFQLSSATLILLFWLLLIAFLSWPNCCSLYFCPNCSYLPAQISSRPTILSRTLVDDPPEFRTLTCSNLFQGPTQDKFIACLCATFPNWSFMPQR